jgi:4,5-DOPA dioxygenase extradiol
MSRMPVLFVGQWFADECVGRESVLPRLDRPWKTSSAPKRHSLRVGALVYARDADKRYDCAQQVYDMYGFPETLYRVKYPPRGAPELRTAFRNFSWRRRENR